jgi:hypothetical protein
MKSFFLRLKKWYNNTKWNKFQKQGYIMLKKWSLVITLIATLSLTNCKSVHIVKSNPCVETAAQTQPSSLATYNHYSAGVLTTITENGDLYAFVTREATGSKDKQGKPTKYGKLYKYDTFSGGKDKGETHPIETAAHEFLQEGMLAKILEWDLPKTKEFIKNNTWEIIAYSTNGNPNIPHIREARNVTYIADFTPYVDIFCDKFHDARKKEIAQYKKDGTPKSQWTNAEKDRAAKIKWDDLRKATIEQEDPNEILTVDALVMNPRTKKFTRQTVELRPLFVAAVLRPIFLDKPYKHGEDEKIRYYQD